MGNATAKTSLTYGVELHGFSKQAAESVHSVPVQLQLRYTTPTGEEVLQVLTMHQPVSVTREKAEEDVHGTCVALYGIHAAARLAQQGEYRPARCRLISTCRLLQRTMRNTLHQEAYLSFIVQAEKLDGFMRERELQDKVFGADKSTQRGRDDDASRSMYRMKNLSTEEFAS